jgi:hypothetical protein
LTRRFKYPAKRRLPIIVDRRTVWLNIPICVLDICNDFGGIYQRYSSRFQERSGLHNKVSEPFEGGIVFLYVGDGWMEVPKGYYEQRGLGSDSAMWRYLINGSEYQEEEESITADTKCAVRDVWLMVWKWAQCSMTNKVKPAVR